MGRGSVAQALAQETSRDLLDDGRSLDPALGCVRGGEARQRSVHPRSHRSAPRREPECPAGRGVARSADTLHRARTTGLQPDGLRVAPSSPPSQLSLFPSQTLSSLPNAAFEGVNLPSPMANQSLIGDRLLGFLSDLGSMLADTKLKALDLTLVPSLGRHLATLISQRPRSVNTRRRQSEVDGRSLPATPRCLPTS